MMKAKQLKDWVNDISDDADIAISDDAMTLVVVGKENELWCEVGAVNKPGYRLSKVFIDSPTTALEAYVAVGVDWNGWVLPYFTREQADAWMRWQNTVPGCTATYNAQTDTYASQYLGEDPDDWPPVGIEVDGQTLHVYPIGAGCWVWSAEI
jgi:hypothetical protein